MRQTVTNSPPFTPLSYLHAPTGFLLCDSLCKENGREKKSRERKESKREGKREEKREWEKEKQTEVKKTKKGKEHGLYSSMRASPSAAVETMGPIIVPLTPQRNTAESPEHGMNQIL